VGQLPPTATKARWSWATDRCHGHSPGGRSAVRTPSSRRCGEREHSVEPYHARWDDSSKIRTLGVQNAWGRCGHAIIGLDGAYVRSRHRRRARNFEVIAGKGAPLRRRRRERSETSEFGPCIVAMVERSAQTHSPLSNVASCTLWRHVVLKPQLAYRTRLAELGPPDVAAHRGQAAVPRVAHDLSVRHTIPVAIVITPTRRPCGLTGSPQRAFQSGVADAGPGSSNSD